MPLVPREPGREDWLGEDEVIRAWRVRRAALHRVAELGSVPYELRGGRSRGTYGAEPTYRCFAPDDVRRVTDALRDGSLVPDPSWRTDTPEGREAERRERRSGRLVDGLFFGPVLLLVLGALLYGWLAR
ncbi:hypothetical protein GCM10010503_50150 [Streptomyces lucensis JCM 4490]|uniref:Uncharacterized protein n=1 Tax=Streptomyces lucensis JCM 4490 TaxID=1306176 RepID=A0A918MTB4_9ACTN|nr:hypothetical protein [Streptomyces lucensis]GGW66844.1 hypothetical protein GCM10010503_50150 [Streptomyces lucensis JCM 4490]